PLPKMEGRGRGFLAGAALGALIGALGGSLAIWRPPFLRSISSEAVAVIRHIFPQDVTILSLALFVVSVCVAQYLVVFIHELAHAVVGVGVGFGFNSLRVGRLQFDRPFRISLYKGKGTGSSGWASIFPVKIDRLVLRATV